MRRLVALALACCSAILCACAPRAASENSLAAQNGPKIVTLMPSFADDVYAIGAGSQLVAVSAFTDAPQARRLPRIADAASVDVEAILALRPGAVIGIPAQARFVQSLENAGVRVVLLADDSYPRIFTNLRAIGALTHRVGAADSLIGKLRRETAALHARTKTFARHPGVFVVLGSAPIWTAGAGSYITTLIELAGGKNTAGDLHAAYGQYSAEALLRDQPDVVIADPSALAPAVLDREPWRSLQAVRRGRVYVVNPDILERPGPRYNDGVRWLLARLTPLAR